MTSADESVSGDYQTKPARWSGLLGAGLCAGLGLLLLVSPLGRGLDRLSYDLPFAMRPAARPTEAVIVYIDDSSMLKTTQPYHQPLDRARLARLLERLTNQRARAVVLDIEFIEAGRDPGADLALARALRAHGRVVLGSNFDETGAYGEAKNFKELLPLELFRTNAASLGLVRVCRVADQTVRQFYAGQPDLPTVTSSLSWAAAQLVGAPVTTNAAARWQTRWLNYYGPPGISIPSVSYDRALEANGVRPDFFRDKVVFIGGKSGTGFIGDRKDEFRHPCTWLYDTFSSGVEIHATMFLNFLRGEWLTRAPAWAEFLAQFAVATVFGYGLTRLRPMRAALVAASGLVSAGLAGWALVWSAHVWIGWASAAIVVIPAALGWSLICQAHLAAAASGGRSQHATSMVVPAAAQRPDQRELPTQTIGGVRGPAQGATARLRIPDHELVRCIGRGSYGEVWLAQNVLGTFRAVKIVRRQEAGEDQPFDREFAGILKFEPISRLHDGLVDVLQVGRNDAAGYFYYVLELADDLATGRVIEPASYQPRTLRAELATRGRFPTPDCLGIAMTLSSALGFLHDQRLVHRDIKPTNIVFVNAVPKLADIGLVADVREARTFVGTQGYLAPEGPGTFQADIFSLGMVLYEMASGYERQKFPAFPESGPCVGEADQQQALRRMILKACQSDAGQRYQSARDLLADLQALTRR